MDVAQILDTMFKLCLAMAVGFGLKKARIFSEHSDLSFSELIVTVTSPALTVYSVCQQSEINGEVLKLLVAGGAFYLAMPAVAWLLMPILRPSRENRGVYQLLLVFANVSFMGFPVIQAIYGEQAIFYMNLFNMPFSLLIFTYGVCLLRGGRETGASSAGWRVILTPGFLSGLVALGIYFVQARVPSILSNALGFVGNVTTPLSMMVIGSMIGGFPLLSLVRERKLFLLSGVKLLLFPALGFLAARLIFQDPMLIGVVTISLGMPAGTLCAMITREYGSETQASTGAVGVFLSTILSMVTVPILILLMR